METYALGFGEPVPISAEHGQGMADLFQALLPHLEREEENAPAAEDDEELADAVLKLAIVGRPNAGKSTLINRILEIGRAHVWTTVTNAQLVCRLLLDNKQKNR